MKTTIRDNNWTPSDVNMYSPNSPVLSSINDHHPLSALSSSQSTSLQCLRFKYFTTFVICTTCLSLLSASLATHKWIVSKPIRILRLNGSSQKSTNFTALMLTAAALDSDHDARKHQPQPSSLATSQQEQNLLLFNNLASMGAHNSGQSNKFQGEIYFGLFNGVKVLNYGFGDRVSQISVSQAYFTKDNNNNNHQHHQQQRPPHELVNFKLWLSTLFGVSLAILFALIGSIFAIINFVMTPRGTLTGPVGLVIWNAAACFSCLLAMVAWLVEYFIRLKANVLTQEEVQNGWTSENRSQFGYSYYFVVLAFVLHLVNIFIVSIVQFETWNSHKAAKRQSHRSACEGVIMLY